MLDKFLAVLFSKTTLAVSALVTALLGATLLSNDGYKEVTCDANDMATCFFCGAGATDTCGDMEHNCGVTACNSVKTCGDNSCNFMMNCSGGCYSDKANDCYLSLGDSDCVGCLDKYCTDEDGGFTVNCEGKK